jgi:hypothetical protein
MTEAVIMDSMEIWRQNGQRSKTGTEDAANAMIEEEIALIKAEAEANKHEMETRMNLEVEKEQGEVEEHHEEDSDDDFEPEDGLDDIDTFIDPGFVSQEGAHELEQQREKWRERQRREEREEGDDQREETTETETDTETETGRGRETNVTNFADDEGGGAK